MMDYDSNVVIAVDFDGTITKRDNYPDPSYEYDPNAIRWLTLIRKLPVVLVLWTCSGDERIQKIRNEMVKLHGLWFDYANEYPFRGFSKKLNADIYIDDRANNGVIDWMGIYSKIEHLIEWRCKWKEKSLTND